MTDIMFLASWEGSSCAHAQRRNSMHVVTTVAFVRALLGLHKNGTLQLTAVIYAVRLLAFFCYEM